MTLSKLTSEVMQAVEKVALDCLDFDDAWCLTGSESVAEYLRSVGIEATHYCSTGYDIFGGVNIDSSHEYVVLSDGTVLDPTITQFRDAPRASMEQKEAVAGFPTLPGSAFVAVIPVGHPFLERLEYESHTKGKGFLLKPVWFQREWEGLTPEESIKLYGPW